MLSWTCFVPSMVARKRVGEDKKNWKRGLDLHYRKRRTRMGCNYERKKRNQDEDRKGRLGFIKKWEMHDTFREVQNSSNDQLKSN